MDIRQIRYFVALAEELHFRRAAARLSISQPPLSAAIKALEQELGVALFHRNSKRVIATASGIAFYPEALKVLAQVASASSVARQAGSGLQGRLELGFVAGMILRGLPELLKSYGEAHRGVDVTLREMSSVTQLQAISSGQLEGGFLHFIGLSPLMESLVVRSESFVCCLPLGHPLSGASTINVGDLANECLVMFARDISPGYFDSVIALCEEAGFSPILQHQVTHWLSAVLLVSRGMGVALLPEAYQACAVAGVTFVPIQPPKCSLAHFVWKVGNANPVLGGFVRVLKNHIADDGKPK